MEKIEMLILGMIIFIAVFGLLLSGTLTGQVYGGALKNIDYPYLEGRSAKGVPVTPEGIRTATEQEASAQAVPYKTYKRMPNQIPSELTSCRQGIQVTTNFLRQFRETYPTAECEYAEELDAYCCTVVGMGLRY